MHVNDAYIILIVYLMIAFTPPPPPNSITDSVSVCKNMIVVMCFICIGIYLCMLYMKEQTIEEKKKAFLFLECTTTTHNYIKSWTSATLV